MKKIIHDARHESTGVVIDMAKAMRARDSSRNIGSELRKRALREPAPTNGIDHTAPEPQQRDRTVSGMSASFRRNAKSRMTKLLTDLARMRALADKTRYRWTDADIDKMEQTAFNEMQETFSAFRAGTGSKKLFSFD